MGSIGEQVYWAANDNRVDELREGHCLAWLPLVPWAAQRPRATRTLVNHTAKAPKPHVRLAKI